jgi:hypothetical protein
MCKIRDIFFQAAAVTAIVTALSVLPASGSEVASRPEATASTEFTVLAIDNRNLIAAADAMVPAMRRKPTPIRNVQTLHRRSATASHHDWSCSGSWCGRQFVLIIGIGY